MRFSSSMSMRVSALVPGFGKCLLKLSNSFISSKVGYAESLMATTISVRITTASFSSFPDYSSSSFSPASIVCFTDGVSAY